MPLIFLDLETTGLNALRDNEVGAFVRNDRILEVAVIVTDDALQEVGRFQRVTCEARNTDFSKVDSHVLEMHAKNGLWSESLVAPAAASASAVGYELGEFLTSVLPPSDKKPVLAGNSIWFDRGFLRVWMPNIDRRLHYRMYDVSTINEFAYRARTATYEARPRTAEGAAHRAMPDVENSLACARHYAAQMGGEQ